MRLFANMYPISEWKPAPLISEGDVVSDFFHVFIFCTVKLCSQCHTFLTIVPGKLPCSACFSLLSHYQSIFIILFQVGLPCSGLQPKNVKKLDHLTSDLNHWVYRGTS